MKISYDYEELISELRSEFEAGLLPSSIIQILRGEPILSGYRPIIDWYYSDEETLEYLSSEGTQEEFNIYTSDKPLLEQVTLHDVLEEMEEWNEIL